MAVCRKRPVGRLFSIPCTVAVLDGFRVEIAVVMEGHIVCCLPDPLVFVSK